MRKNNHKDDTMYNFLHTTEFYVIMTVMAAAVVAACARPSRRGQARTYFAEGILSAADDGGTDTPVSAGGAHGGDAEVYVACGETTPAVTIVRRGLQGVSMSGTVALAITVIGFDVDIKERITPGHPGDPPATQATMILDFLGRERYHIHYTSESTQRHCAFSLNVRPGLKLTHTLKQ